LTTFNIEDRFNIGDMVCFYNCDDSDALVGVVVGWMQNNKGLLYRVDWLHIADERLMQYHQVKYYHPSKLLKVSDVQDR
jgi:hypothetical protein